MEMGEARLSSVLGEIPGRQCGTVCFTERVGRSRRFVWEREGPSRVLHAQLRLRLPDTVTNLFSFVPLSL